MGAPYSKALPQARGIARRCRGLDGPPRPGLRIPNRARSQLRNARYRRKVETNHMKLLLLLIYLAIAIFDAAAAFRAGIAVRNVTPEPLLPVSGGVGASHRTTKKEGELTVRALVLEQDRTRVAIVSADFLGFPAVLGNQVRAAVKEIPGDNILIGATHTHSGPDCYGFRDPTGVSGRDEKYPQWR